MPSWELHRKWAKEAGISCDICSYVDKLIDFPKDKGVKGFLDFCGDITKWIDYYDNKSSKSPFKARQLKDIPRLKAQLSEWRKNDIEKFMALIYGGHDSGRSKKGPPGLQAHIQLSFLKTKGAAYVRAWYLHHFLDYMKSEHLGFPKEEICKRLSDRTKPGPEFDNIKLFVAGYWDEIIKDLENDT